MIGIRASKGLGDAVHLRAAVLHLIDRGEQVTVFTLFADVFADLPVTIRPLPEGDTFEGLRHFNAKWSDDRQEGSNFTAECRRAGIAGPVELQARWSVKNRALVDAVRAAARGRNIFIYQPRKVAHNPAQELIRPNHKPYRDFIAGHHDHFRIKLGQWPYVEEDAALPCELDLFGKTSVADAFDIATIGDLFFGESCFIPMIGEAMDRKNAIMFTRRALNSSDRVRNVKPERIFHKMHLAIAVYDES